MFPCGESSRCAYVSLAWYVVGIDIVFQSSIQRVVSVSHPFDHGRDLMVDVLIVGDLRVERLQFF